jgi:cellulose synthase/poly-beta-1,6-N-acetylglucosamine synthase-like glycosyltransferase
VPVNSVANFAATLFAACWTLQLVLGCCFFYVLWLYRHLRAEGLAGEARLLALTDARLPHVVVQIPSFNEGDIVRRIGASAAAFDWPVDRLHLQFLDDSTDGSETIIAELVVELKARGIDAELIRRDSRAGFKAGALQGGLLRSEHAFFAIFDADYVPARDFLRRCMPILLADPQLAFVQARFDYLNPAENLLTRAQAVLLDHHLGIEQRVRSWAGHMVPCNGTCVIWRRTAIDAAGGWRGDTLAEDMDLSYRAWLKGWRGTYLGGISAPGELPTVGRHWLRQQRRWKQGYNQIAWRYLPRILVSVRLPLSAKWSVFLHLGFALSSPLSMVTTWTGVIAGLLVRAKLVWIIPAWLVLFLLGYVAAVVALRMGTRELRQTAMPLGSFARACLAGFAWRVYMDLLDGVIALRRNLLRRPKVFERTPKFGRAQDTGGS